MPQLCGELERENAMRNIVQLERRAVGGFIRDNRDGTVTAHDVYGARRATLPIGKARRLLAAFDSMWPRADYLDSIRHLIANA